ncbi:MAG: helix-turn-helix domain containing protein [Rhizobium sp.]|nr:helix-turn-helix domain containing protein [Rhizobium sp.]
MKQVKEVTERKRGRPRRGNEQNAEGLLDAALETFAAFGFEQTSMRSIATAAGVDVALISYRYGSKVGIWKATVTEVARETVELLQLAVKRAEEQAEADRIDFISSEMVEVIWRRPHFSKLLFSEILTGQDEERKNFIEEALARPFFELLYPFMQKNLILTGRQHSFDTRLGILVSIAIPGLLSSTQEFTGRLVEVARQDDSLRLEIKQVVQSLWAGPEPSPSAEILRARGAGRVRGS